MTINEKDGKLTIALEGRIDTNNAAQTEKEIFDSVGGRTDDITIDAEKHKYISSAGLRVLMKLRKSINKPLPVINVSRDVYDIFETTGFTELLDVKKAMRKVSLTGCEVIGQGGHGKLQEYAVKFGILLKTLNSTEADPKLYGNIKDLS